MADCVIYVQLEEDATGIGGLPRVVRWMQSLHVVDKSNGKLGLSLEIIASDMSCHQRAQM